jgi:hypothetical protein
MLNVGYMALLLSLGDGANANGVVSARVYIMTIKQTVFPSPNSYLQLYLVSDAEKLRQ